ncbi:MAG: hypothetical protein RL260_2202 [Pseudomonadota bacterium]
MPTPSASATPPQSLPMQTREASIVPSSYDEAEGTIELVWTTGARGIRYDWWKEEQYEEELQVTPESVDMTRFEAGTVQALDSHSTYSLSTVLGRAVQGWITDGQGHARVKLSVDPEKAGRIADIKAGVIRSVSVGYTVQRYEVIEAADRTDGRPMKLVRATRWTPHEISFVNVPFDTGSTTRSADPRTEYPVQIITRSATAGRNLSEQPMPQSNAGGTTTATQTQDELLAAERTRASEIITLCRDAGVPEQAADMIGQGLTVEASGLKLLRAMANKDAAAGGHINVTTTRDEGATRQLGLEEALVHRLDPRAKLTDNGRQHRGLSLMDMGRELLDAGGVKTRGMDRMTVAGYALQTRSAPGYMGSTDFGAVLANVANKRMREAYERIGATYKLWARQAAAAPDLKDINIVQISDAPGLRKIGESGEYTYGAFSDAGNSYRMGKAGRIIAFTDEMLINDDLRSYDRMVTAFGAAAGDYENELVYALLTGNVPVQGAPMFDAAHANVGTAAALDVDSLRAARMLMRKQIGMKNKGEGEDKTRPLNISPKYLLVPSDLETAANMLTSSNYVPTTQGDINEFAAGGRNALDPIVEPLLDGAPNRWFLAADSWSRVDTVEYCYLEGQNGPVITQKQGWEVDGVELKCKLYFAAAAVDWRGMARMQPA